MLDLTNASAVAVNAASTELYIADEEARRVYRVASSNSGITLADALDPTYADTFTAELYVGTGSFAPAAPVCGGGSALATDLQGPGGLALSDDGILFVADWGWSAVCKIDLGGAIELAAGGAVIGHGGDGGAANVSELSNPGPLAIRNELLYIGVVDRIRSMTTSNTTMPISTVVVPSAPPTTDWRRGSRFKALAASRPSTCRSPALRCPSTTSSPTPTPASCAP